MECDCLSHSTYEDYHSRTSRLLEQEHHTASVQLEEVLGRHVLRIVQKLLDDGLRST